MAVDVDKLSHAQLVRIALAKTTERKRRLREAFAAPGGMLPFIRYF